ncbi:MAG: hypothetical protein DIU58_013990 [Sphaerobacter thermophilus]|uniref:TolB family protein n=1 Tax=Sphaerobacter thermophilus TaxID=2057 RepID=UPI000DB5E98F|nr:MAG: peptidase domain-containing protein [Sphaerobacter thermophilus]
MLALIVILSALPLAPSLAVTAASIQPSGLVAYLDRGNNLWVSQDSGAGAVQLTTAGGYTGFVWSPDGTRLAAVGPVSGGAGVSLVGTDPSFGVRELHTGTAPAWSPDSRRVAIIDGGTVHIYDREGGYQRSVGVGADAIQWSPDGRRIGFTRWLSDPYGTGCAIRDLGWIDADTGASHGVARTFGKFAWAGDGARLLYVSADDGTVRAFDTRSGSGQRLSSRSANPCGGPFFTSNDGRTLFFLDYGAGGRDLVAVNLSSLQERVYRNLPIGYPARTLPDSYVSVDPLARFAYVVQTYPTTITRVDLQSGALQQMLFNDYRMVLGFSPDRDRVALLATPYGEPSVTYIRDLTTGEETAFTNVGWLAWQGTPITASTVDAWTRVWDREDRPVAALAAHRTWIWGPAPFATRQEPYLEAPGGRRAVQYYDKSRMEVTHPDGDQSSRWYVTNGLLVKELITGQMQVGDASFVERGPAHVPVAGDPDDTLGPTYATLQGVLSAPPTPAGTEIRATIDRHGNVGSDGPGGVFAQEYIPDTNHTIADVFWAYLNSRGLVWDGANFVDGKLFEPTFFATGFPITEPYWTKAKVGGEVKDVLVQCFERRCLTYTPSNPEGWKVEMGNVGRHYYAWRYGG